MFTGCCDGNLTLMAEIVEACSERNLLNTIIDIPLSKVIPPLLETLSAFVLTLAGVDADSKSDSQSGDESMPFADYHAKLFRIGTGWLGWSPETTWNATAAEITEAYSGHIEMLRAIHGGSEETDRPTTRQTDKPQDAVFDRAGLKALKLCQ